MSLPVLAGQFGALEELTQITLVALVHAAHCCNHDVQRLSVTTLAKRFVDLVSAHAETEPTSTQASRPVVVFRVPVQRFVVAHVAVTVPVLLHAGPGTRNVQRRLQPVVRVRYVPWAQSDFEVAKVVMPTTVNHASADMHDRTLVLVDPHAHDSGEPTHEHQLPSRLIQVEDRGRTVFELTKRRTSLSQSLLCVPQVAGVLVDHAQRASFAVAQRCKLLLVGLTVSNTEHTRKRCLRFAGFAGPCWLLPSILVRQRSHLLELSCNVKGQYPIKRGITGRIL